MKAYVLFLILLSSCSLFASNKPIQKQGPTVETNNLDENLNQDEQDIFTLRINNLSEISDASEAVVEIQNLAKEELSVSNSFLLLEQMHLCITNRELNEAHWVSLRTLLPFVVEKLKIPNVAYRRTSLHFFLDFINSSAQNAQAVLITPGFFKELAINCTLEHIPYVQNLAFQILSFLFEGYGHLMKQAAGPFTSILRKLACDDSAHPSVRVNSLAILGSIIRCDETKSEERRELLTEAGLIPIACEFLENEDSSFVMGPIIFLGAMSGGSNSYERLVETHDLPNRIALLLKRFDSPSGSFAEISTMEKQIFRESLLILSNLADESDQSRSILLATQIPDESYSLMQQVLKLANSQAIELKLEANYVLLNMLNTKEEDLLAAMLFLNSPQDLVSALTESLRGESSAQLAQISLGSIEFLISNGSADLNKKATSCFLNAGIIKLLSDLAASANQDIKPKVSRVAKIIEKMLQESQNTKQA